MDKGCLQQALAHVHPLSGLDTAYWLHQQAEAIFVKHGRQGFCIEIGTWVGFTAIAMALSRAYVHAIDTFDARDRFTGHKRVSDLKSFMQISAADPVDLRAIFEDNVKTAKVWDNLMGFKLESVKAASLYATEVADLIFIDADHSKEAIKDDLEVWTPILKPGGLLVVDNFDGIQDVTVATVLFLKEHGWPDAQHAADVMFYSRKPMKGAEMAEPKGGRYEVGDEQEEPTRPYVIGGIGGNDKQEVAEAIIAEAREYERMESLMYLCMEILFRLKALGYKGT